MILLRLILFFILFLIIIRLVRLIMRYMASSKKPTIDDLRQEHKNENPRFKDVEEAKFKEINFDEEEDINKQD